MLGAPGPLPCTPRGVVELLRRNGIALGGAEVCVIGRGTTVGRPLGLLLTRKSENATVTLCHTGTTDLAQHTRQADIVVAAAGRPGLVTADMVKPGAVCVDVGITRTEHGLVGDIDASVARGGLLGRTGAWRGRPDDPGDAAHQRGGAGRAARVRRVMAAVTTPRRARDEPAAAARALRAWPLLVVLAGVVAGLGIAVLGPATWRAGCLVIGARWVVGAVSGSLCPAGRPACCRCAARPSTSRC